MTTLVENSSAEKSLTEKSEATIAETASLAADCVYQVKTARYRNKADWGPVIYAAILIQMLIAKGKELGLFKNSQTIALPKQQMGINYNPSKIIELLRGIIEQLTSWGISIDYNCLQTRVDNFFNPSFSPSFVLIDS